MLACPKVINAVIRTGAIIVSGSVSPNGDFIYLPGFGIGEFKFRKEGMVAGIFERIILLFTMLLPENPLPFLKAKVFWFVRSGYFHGN